MAAYREEAATAAVAAAGSPAAAPGGMDAPITRAEIQDALNTLKNGKAPSPVTRIPNELLKYGSGAMAGILTALYRVCLGVGQRPAPGGLAAWRGPVLPQVGGLG